MERLGMRKSYDGKYRPLHDHLTSVSDPQEPMTFGQIEDILGFALPASARIHQAWWANQERGQSLAWVTAGFRTVFVTVDEERLTFLREDHPDFPAERPLEPLTIAEAKERLALTLGIQPSQIEITIRA
jgi:hypothetical protein